MRAHDAAGSSFVVQMKPVAIFAVATGSICIMIAVYLPPLPQGHEKPLSNLTRFEMAKPRPRVCATTGRLPARSNRAQNPALTSMPPPYLSLPAPTLPADRQAFYDDVGASWERISSLNTRPLPRALRTYLMPSHSCREGRGAQGCPLDMGGEAIVEGRLTGVLCNEFVLIESCRRPPAAV